LPRARPFLANWEAGHAFFAHYRPNYRVEPAVDGGNRVFAFFGKNLKA